VARECLGNRLVAAGRLETRELQESLRRVRAGEGRQGEVLVKMGVLTETEIAEALAEQSAEKLWELFTWVDGAVQIQRGAPDLSLTSALPPGSARELVLAGAAHLNRHRTERLLEPHRDQPLRVGARELSVEEAAVPGVASVLQAARGGATVGSLTEGQTNLAYVLRSLGAVRFGDEDAGEVDPATATGPGVTEAELRELLGRYRDANHFEVLDLGVDPADEEVRVAFLKLAKRFHPDRFAAGAMKQLAGEVFTRVTQAHDILADAHARADYVQGLGRAKLEGGGKPAVAQIMAAETKFHEGTAHYRKREYAEARAKLEEAVELNPQEGEFRALFGLVHALLHRGDLQEQGTARGHLEAGLALAPKSANAHYYSGLFRKTCGEMVEAERMFRRALELAPSHAEATRELRVIGLRKEKGREAGGLSGLFGFGKKK
jgi:curved DNA-binding protein CbpA